MKIYFKEHREIIYNFFILCHYIKIILTQKDKRKGRKKEMGQNTANLRKIAAVVINEWK